MATRKPNRVQLDFSDSDMRRIETLKARGDCVTRAELFKKTLLSYEWLLDIQEKGSVVIVKDTQGVERQVQFVGL